MEIRAEGILFSTQKAYFVKYTDDLGFWIPKVFYKDGYVNVPDDFEIKLRKFEIDTDATRYYGERKVNIAKDTEFKPITLNKENVKEFEKLKSVENDTKWREVENYKIEKDQVLDNATKKQHRENVEKIEKNATEKKALEKKLGINEAMKGDKEAIEYEYFVRGEIDKAFAEKGYSANGGRALNNLARKQQAYFEEIKKRGLKGKQVTEYLDDVLGLNILRAKKIESSKAIELEYQKKLTEFATKINNSVKFWSLANFNKNFDKNVAKQLTFEFNKLLEYWQDEAKEFGESISKRITNYIQKYVNSKFLSENADFKKNFVSKLERNQLTAIYERNLDLIKSIPKDIIEDYRQVLLNNVNNFDREALEKQAKTIEGISKRRAKTIARDQTHKATIDYQSARAESLGFEYYQWTTSQDERVSKGKGGHDKLNGRIYKYSVPTAVIDSYGNKGHCGDRVNCLPKGVGIDFNYFPSKLFRFSIGDKFTKLTFDSGSFLITTSKHKVLTSRGFVSVDSLNKGDKIIKIMSECCNIDKIDFNNNKVIISQIFDFIDKIDTISFSEALTFKRVGVSGNFDTDIRLDEKVNIIDVDCFLRDCGDIFFSKMIKELNLSKSQMSVFENIFVSGNLSTLSRPYLDRLYSFYTPNRFVCFFSEKSSIFSGAIFESNEVGFTARADFISEFIKPICDNTSTNIKIFSHFQDAISSNVSLFKLFYVYIFIIFWNHFSRICNAPRIKLSENDSFSGVELLSNLSNANALQSEIVNSVEIVNIKSHIYSLETELGYYTINNTINKNCRCVPVSVYLKQDEEAELVKDAEAGDYYRIIKKSTSK